MKRLFVFFIVHLLLSTGCIQANEPAESTSPEELFFYFKKTNLIDEKIELLTKAISTSHYKKWPKYPLARLERASCYIQQNNTDMALKDYLFLTKKFKIYYEPFLEASFIYFKQGKYKKSYSLTKKAYKNATTSLKEMDGNHITNKDFFHALLKQLKIITEIFLNKKSKANKSFKKSFADIENSNFSWMEGLDENSKNLININFIKAFYYYSFDYITPSRKQFLKALEYNWECEINPIFLFILNQKINFRNFYLDIKSEFSEKKWSQIINQKRKNWQKDKWKVLLEESKTKPLLR